MDWSLLIDLGKIVGGLTIVITTVWKVVPLIWKKLTEFAMEDVQQQVNQMATDIKYIVSELKTNGGTSLRDAINFNNNQTIELTKIVNNIEILSQRNIEVQRAKMDNEEQMIFLADRKGEIVWVNRSYLRHTKRTANEVKGNGWVNILYSSNKDECVKEWFSSVNENREFEKVCRLVDSTGITFDVDVRSYKLMDNKGETTGWMGVCTVLGEKCPRPFCGV